MNVYIQTDIEGIAGFASFEDRDTESFENHHHRMRMYRLLTEEVSAAVRAAKESGAGKIWINDSHGSGYNIIFEDLEDGCEIIHGRGGHFPKWLTSLDEGFDCMVQVGMHAMGGDVSGVCAHSRWEVNGGDIYMSEASMAMALAGDLNIPCVFVSGDQVITAEVLAKCPQMETAVVKHAYGLFSCRSVHPNQARQMIFEGVKKGIARIAGIPPYQPKGPFTLNLLESAGHIPPLKPVLPEPVKGATITEVFEKTLAQFPWAAYGKNVFDWYRFPANLEGKKPGTTKG